MRFRSLLRPAFDTLMNPRKTLQRLAHMDALNFVLTNRIPRRWLTRLIGWVSHTTLPPVPQVSMALWRWFADLDLSDARQQRFASLHACFTRELRAGARTIDTRPNVLSSPCDAIVGECGHVRDGQLLQAKSQAYALEELLLDPALAEQHRNGCFVTLRLTSSMYHRFHAPHDCTVHGVQHVPGDVWNVNPPALARVPKLYCRNERAVIRTTLNGRGQAVTLVPVAAILVAGIQLNFIGPALRLSQGALLSCSAVFQKGQEMGHFEHGSTIIVLGPAEGHLAAGIVSGTTIRMGQALMQLPNQ